MSPIKYIIRRSFFIISVPVLALVVTIIWIIEKDETLADCWRSLWKELS